MKTTFGHIVLGLGAMGSAALCELARRGERVLGIEQFDVPHELGSSHGLTRIIRLAYNEHSKYVPLLRRSYEMWRRLEHDAGDELLIVTGGLDIGPEAGRVFAGAKESCEEHGLEHEVLVPREISARYPGFELPSDFHAVFQPDAGYLRAERSVVAHVNQARGMGATVLTREPVLDWSRDGESFRVKTGSETYETESLIVTAGPWASKLLPRLAGLARPQRQVVGWFAPLEPDHFAPARCPVFILDSEEGEYYGFPVDHETPGFKIGRFCHREEWMDPDGPRAAPDAVDEEVLRRAVRRYLPQACGDLLMQQSCVFTMSPDRHFILDRVPDVPGLTLGAGFSGHGFKFATVVGEILADLASTGSTAHDIELFSATRF